ncbi:MAG TPA: NUDIX hydrolase [Candidatus Limnocylindria bacterium]|jgi:ADP-ribose pyrophosphatase|nr:NUDIX hydrolase [Candidatus Limnocylindria bacterium]
MTHRSDSRLREALVRRDEIHRGAYLVFRRDVVADADGGEHVREVVVHPGGVCVLALLPDERLLFVRQYRHAVGEVLLEIPAGTLDRGADGEREDPAAAAARELAEETGYRAGRWRELGSFFTAPGFATEEMFIYLAWQLEPVEDYAGPAPDERLELATLSLDDALALAKSGGVRDAKTIVGLYLADELRRAGELPATAS